MKFIRFFVAISLLCGLADTSYAKAYLCTTLFPEGGDIHLQASSDFRVIPDEPFLSFRGSVAHFWKWVAFVKREFNPQAGNKSQLDQKIARLLSTLGFVVGDFHPGNWGDIEFTDGRKTGLIDLDDVGVSAPLIGDFLRGAIGVHLAKIDISPEKLWEAYVLGLKKLRTEKPDRLVKIQSKSSSSFSKRQQAYLTELTNGTNTFSPEAGLIPIQNAPFLARQLYASLKDDLHGYFRDYVILDVGFRMKLIGGSQRLPRFWFLLKDPKTNKNRVAEAKYLVKPGTAEFGPQGTAAHRIALAGASYRPEGDVVGFYDVLQSGVHEFQVRERFDNFVNFDPIKMKAKLSPEELESTLLYIFNQMGRFQARQLVTGELLKAIEENPESSELAILALTQSYLQLVRQEMRSESVQ